MKKPDSFPFQTQIAGLVFRVHLAPQETKLKDGTTTQYESFLLQYYEAGQRIQKRRSSWEAIDELIEDVVAAHRQQDPERLELTGRDRRLYLSAVEALQSTGVEVDKAAQEFAEAARLLKDHGLGVLQGAQHLASALENLKGASLQEAVEFFRRHQAADIAPATVTEVIEKLLAEKKANNRGDYHLRDLENRLSRFAEAFPGPIQPITEAQISGWLQGLQKRSNKGVESQEKVSPRTRNNYRDAVNELWGFARKRAFLPRHLETAAAATERVTVVPGDNHILSPDELIKLLEVLPPKLLVPVVIKNFCGLRTEENHPFRWEFLRHESKAMVIKADLAKLSQRRAPPILPNLAKWLQPFQGLEGPINPDYTTPQTLHQAIERASARAGVTLQRNTFRNCYISYRVAQPYPVDLVAQETGTSKGMIEANYRELATAREAKMWFSIVPTQKQLKALKAYAAEIRVGMDKNPSQEASGRKENRAAK
jgi:hypothetical protein